MYTTSRESLVTPVEEPEQDNGDSFMQQSHANQLQYLQTRIEQLQAENTTLHTQVTNLRT